MSEIPDEVYEAAAKAMHARYHRGWSSCANDWSEHIRWARELTDCAVDAVRPLIEADVRDRIAANLEQAAFLSTLVTDGHVGKALRAEIDSRSKAYESAAKIARGTA